LRKSRNKILAGTIERGAKAKPTKAVVQWQDDAKLAGYAKQILNLGRRASRDVIKIGKLLKDARKRLPHGAWLPWLDSKIGMSPDTAERFINVHEHLGSAKFRRMRNLPPPTVLYAHRPLVWRAAVLCRPAAAERLLASRHLHNCSQGRRERTRDRVSPM
jgi:hypothetical protein